MDIKTLTSGALIKHPSRGLLLGTGPFRESAEPPDSGPAFYIDTFRLDDPRPWKIPAALHALPAEGNPPPPAPEIRWTEPSPDTYAQVFAEMMEQIAAGQLMKSVPAIPQFGEMLLPHTPRELILRAISSSPSHYPYAWWTEREGFCGITPETLFHQQSRRLETMALAGTARPEDEGVFINDDKEIREHEIVAGSILSRLSPFGSVTRTARSVLNLGTLIHFVTYLTLESDDQHTPAHWIRLLHPTPALGSQPRTENTLAQLDDWRSRLRCPLHFGAPFGFLEDGDFFCLVGIRSLYWQGQRLALCTGGGVVASSTLTHEWRELKLKRDTVRRSFHLP
ncbi:chorismate-binding protein [uncultured Akkermansia sp.]|uniref:chorismate-binding protein n=1 Tax=uncultured Akkermansia sp. TaxID=512294 RepID=UPI002594C86B|nr:chorismate-binding protein [uncultured Akkermansia sp.]